MKPSITRKINRISTTANAIAIAIALSLPHLFLPVATQSFSNPGPGIGPGIDPYPNPYPNPQASPPYSEVGHQAQAQAQAQAQYQDQTSAPSVTLRIQPSINDGSHETITVPLIQVTEYRPDEPRYERARAGSSSFSGALDVERAVIVDGPGDSDEIVCMFNGGGGGGGGGVSGVNSGAEAEGDVDVRHGTPFIWGEEASFSGAETVSCIAFYWKGEQGQGGIVENIGDNYDGF